MALAKTRYKRHELDSAARILAFCWQHEATSEEIKNNHTWLHAALEEALPRDRLTAFKEDAAGWSLEEAAAKLFR